MCSYRKARKYRETLKSWIDDQQVIHHWTPAEKVTGQPQLTLLILIVPRCNEPLSDSPKNITLFIFQFETHVKTHG